MFKKIKKFILWLFLGSAVLAGGYSALPDTVPDIAKEKMLIAYDNAPIIKAKYKMQNASFIMEAVDENAMQTEIGDKTKDKFIPEMTLRKWDDECNFKIKYKHSEKEKDLKFELDGEKIKLKGKKIETHFYEMDNENYEFEIILLEKPITNIVSFDIETKGLNFYYQSELTQQEKDDGAERPENVIGSYAVYHESKQGDYSKMGKKNYRAGKAFHIYRPKIIDNAGTEVWGILNITDNLLTVEIPQEFLDNAVYPVRHAAGLTFGYTGTGGGTYFNTFNNEILGQRGTGEVGTANSISIYSYGRYGAQNFKGILVLQSNLNIITNGIGSPVSIPQSLDWYTSTFPTPPTLEAVDYYASGIADGQIRCYYDTGFDSGFTISDSSNDYITPTNPTDAGLYAYRFSIYCTYTAGGEEPPAVKKRRVIRVQ